MKCLQVGVIQYGEISVHEWSLRDYQTTQDVVEAAKNISRQEGRETHTAEAIRMAWYGDPPVTLSKQLQTNVVQTSFSLFFQSYLAVLLKRYLFMHILPFS